jgi:crotonobetainyl-CoA:carnitine CoA-transferase CaiB-like acyl-CoA transferase
VIPKPSDSLPLSGFTVLELGEDVSAPYCGKLLADYGADVIKVEPPQGDPARRHGPFPDDLPHPEKSALFLYLNTNKKSVTLDVSTASGVRLLRRLVEEVDVLVENQPAARLEDLGLSFRDLARLNPRLIMVSVKPFGEGPYGRWKATNLTSFASGGQMYLTGDPDREPLLTGGYQAEYQAGLNAFGATLAALLGLAVMEVGQHIEVSAMECQACVLEIYLPDYAYRRSEALSKRRGNVNSAVIGLYPCQDGYLGIHAMPRQFAALARAMGREDLLTDERFRDVQSRLMHNDELTAEFYAWAVTQTREEAYRRAGECRAPLACVLNLQEVLDSPQMKARRYFQEVEHPAAGRCTYPGPPFRLTDGSQDGESWGWRAGRAPLLGEHNEEVFGELLGLERTDLVRLRAAGVV